MEKRFYLGVGILLVFLVLGLTIYQVIETRCGMVTALLEQAEEAIISGKTETGTQLAQQARLLWKKNWKVTALAADHSPMDEIDGLFAQLEFFAKTGNMDGLGANCARLTELMEAISDAHALTWWNVL